jgi:hypothetical protein
VNKITLITYPDFYHNKSKKVLLVNTVAEERAFINSWLLANPIELTVYLYNNEDQIDWLLNVINQVDTAYINVDNSTDISYYYISYLVSLTNTTWNSTKIDYSIINKEKASNINEYMARNWLG